jgi:hypothetical protein
VYRRIRTGFGKEPTVKLSEVTGEGKRPEKQVLEGQEEAVSSCIRSQPKHMSDVFPGNWRYHTEQCTEFCGKV